MTDILTYKHPDFGAVRAADQNGAPLYSGRDVARVLGYTSPSRAVNAHCEWIEKHVAPTDGGLQNMLFIRAADVWRLVQHSKLPDADKRGKWLAEDVVQAVHQNATRQLRETMARLIQNNETAIKIAEQGVDEQRQRAALVKQIEQDRPKVLFAEVLLSSGMSVSVGKLAKIMRRYGAHMGKNWLYTCLRQDGYLYGDPYSDMYNRPTKESFDRGLFEEHCHTVDAADREPAEKWSIKITPAGQLHFINRYCTGVDTIDE